MKALILSDLHLCFQKDDPFVIPNVDRDVLILLGDINLGTKADKFILEQLVESDVIYVLGNHEFYHQVHSAVKSAWNGATAHRINKEAQSLGYRGTLYVLDDKAIKLDDITFIGATLWTDFAGGNPLVELLAQNDMNDYKCIYSHIDREDWPSKKPITPDYIARQHSTSLYFIEQELAKPGKKVLLTHHSPTFQSIAECVSGSPLNPMYASNLDRLFYDNDDVILAAHGHTHYSFDYVIENTRIICNPRGYYPIELNPRFKPDLIVDL